MIWSELKKEPKPLPELLWTVLRRYRLVREPMEELQSCFANSQEVKPPCTTFADGVTRTLHALLALDPSTRETKVIFVRCATHVVDVGYQADRDLLFVHEKWLRAPDSHQTVPDPAKVQPNAFISHNLVEDLYRRAVTIICQQTKGTQSTANPREVLPLSHQRLRQMPRKIQVTSVEDRKMVTVSFYTGHSLVFVDLYGSQVFYLVTLHGKGCMTEMEKLVYDASRDVCKCPRQAVRLSSRTAVFRDVGKGPWIPMVAKMPDDSSPVEPHVPSSCLKAQDGALVGIPQQETLSTEPNPAGRGVVLHTEGREADLSTPPPATGQATELAAAMPVTVTPPVASDEAGDVIETVNLSGYSGQNRSSLSEPFPPTIQSPAKRPIDTALPSITVADNYGDYPIPDCHKTGEDYADDVNGTDDPASPWSLQAANLVESDSTVASASSRQSGWEVQAAGNGLRTCIDEDSNQGHAIPPGDSSGSKVRRPLRFSSPISFSLRHP